MPAKDLYHNTVRAAIKDDWTITDDSPYLLMYHRCNSRGWIYDLNVEVKPVDEELFWYV